MTVCWAVRRRGRARRREAELRCTARLSSLFPHTTCILEASFGTIFMHTLTLAHQQQEAMPQDNHEEGHKAEAEREGRRMESSGGLQDHFAFKAASTMSPSFQEIRISKTLTFWGLPHTLSILVTQRPPNTDLSLHLTLTTPAPLNQQWMGEYTRPYIEELVGRTSDSGPVSSFAAFVRLLVGALHHQSQDEGEVKRGGIDGGGRIEWPTSEELEGRLQAARRRRKDTNPLSMTTTISSSSSKRYLILTHTAGAARVHYPLPLRLLQASSDQDTPFSAAAAAVPSPSTPCPFLLFDATAAGQMAGALPPDLSQNGSNGDSKGVAPPSDPSSVSPPAPPPLLPPSPTVPAPAPPPASLSLSQTPETEQVQQALPVDSSSLKGADPPISPSIGPATSVVSSPRPLLPPPLPVLDRQRSGSAPSKEGGSESIATQAALRRAKEAAYQKKIQELEIALIREKREVQSLHRQHMKEMADILKHQEPKCSCRVNRSQVFPINTDAPSGRQSPNQASVLEEGEYRGQGQGQVVLPPPATPHPAPVPKEGVGMRAMALLPYLLLFLLLALAIVLIIVLAHGLML